MHSLRKGLHDTWHDLCGQEPPASCTQPLFCRFVSPFLSGLAAYIIFVTNRSAQLVPVAGMCFARARAYKIGVASQEYDLCYMGMKRCRKEVMEHEQYASMDC